MFHYRDGDLWVIETIASPDITSTAIDTLPKFRLLCNDGLPVYVIDFQIILSILQSGLEVSFLKVLFYFCSLAVRALLIVFETSIRNLAKFFTTVLKDFPRFLPSWTSFYFTLVLGTFITLYRLLCEHQ